MALDFQQIYSKIRAIGQGAPARQEFLKKQRERAWGLLETHAGDLNLLRDRVKRTVRDHDPNLRCALPATERLDSRSPAPSMPGAATLIAIDGSQITPDRHEALTYGLINVGAIAMRVNSGGAPGVFTESELLFDEELRNKDGSILNEGGIALRRDAAERRRMLELARQFPAPVITLTDGPLELWGAKDAGNADSYREYLQKYLHDLEQLESLGMTLAGYVDKPAADLLVRLLEIAIANDEDLKNIREYQPLRGVTDRWLYGGLLQPGERSAVFAIQSKSAAHYKGALALRFFYLNVGDQRHPWPVRVEIPKWVADDAEKLDMLHAILFDQCRMMGAKPYPYLLHRAHETALVSMDEKKQVEQMLQMELLRQGGETDEESYKQSAKGLVGRGRFEG